MFTNTFTIASFFKFKDSIPVGLISNIIYEFTCSSCKARYIGETKRNLTHRISEHRGTRKQLGNPSFSAVRTHLHSHDHPFTGEGFNILHKAYAHTDIRTLEDIYKKHMKPEINNQHSSAQLHIL